MRGEFFGTFAPVFAGTGAVVIDAVSGGAMTHIGIALTFGLETLLTGPVCGASMNPAWSLGPTFVSGRFDLLRIYLAAPTLGGAVFLPVPRTN